MSELISGREALVYGVGINDKSGGEFRKVYDEWKRMLYRCSEKNKCKNTTYEKCEVSENFRYFSYFYDWRASQIGSNNIGWHLDKDILLKNNKIYSESLCVYVPREINAVLVKRDKLRGLLPIGVYFHKKHKRYSASISFNARKIHIGMFANKEDAFEAYKFEKEKNIKRIAEKYKDVVDPRVYNALINYNVEITD